MFTKRVVMSQANDSEPVETIALPSLRKESGSAAAAGDARVSRVILRIPDCTARLSTIQGDSTSWWSKLQNVSQLQSISQIAGPWLDVVRPIIPPRVLAASIIGILLGFVMILLTPSEKPIPTFRAHREQAATSQRPVAPPPAVGIDGPLPTLGVTERESAADMAFRPAAPAAVSAPQPQSENVLRPGSSGARLIPAIEKSQ
jgi:hypothetical protein